MSLLLTSECVNASLPDPQGNYLAALWGLQMGPSSDLLPNLAIEHPEMISSAMENGRRKKQVKRPLTWYHVSEHTSYTSAREGKHNGMTNGAELAGQLNQNGKERTGILSSLGNSLGAP